MLVRQCWRIHAQLLEVVNMHVHQHVSLDAHRLCCWQGKLSDTFRGRVIEVVSGDCLVIKDSGSNVERRVQLSR
jgi:hypothetical protein